MTCRIDPDGPRTQDAAVLCARPARVTWLAVPAEANTYAKARFERPSVWERRCPHVVDVLDRDGDQCRDRRGQLHGRLGRRDLADKPLYRCRIRTGPLLGQISHAAPSASRRRR